jgi:hypothetical protein
MSDSKNGHYSELLRASPDPREALLQAASANCRRDELQARDLRDIVLHLALRQFATDVKRARLNESPDAALTKARTDLQAALNALDTFFKEATTQAHAEFYSAFGSAQRTAH